MPAKKRLTALPTTRLMLGVKKRGFSAGSEIEYEPHVSGAALKRVNNSVYVLKVWPEIGLASLGAIWHTADDLGELIKDLQEAVKILESLPKKRST